MEAMKISECRKNTAEWMDLLAGTHETQVKTVMFIIAVVRCGVNRSSSPPIAVLIVFSH